MSKAKQYHPPECRLEFRVVGPLALFTDPVTGLGGDNASLPFPTYEALAGICRSIYWKPTMTWVVEAVRVLNPVRTHVRGVLTRSIGNERRGLHAYAYLWDVAYQVKARLEWDETRPDLAHDRIFAKHWRQAEHALAHGGRRDIFLGTRECQASVEPEAFGWGDGAYDEGGVEEFGLTYHGIDYPTRPGETAHIRFWMPRMHNGVIRFLPPAACTIRKPCQSALTDFYRPSLTA